MTALAHRARADAQPSNGAQATEDWFTNGNAADPRDAELRLTCLFDPDTLVSLRPRDTSGGFAARGRIDEAKVIAYCTDATRMDGAMGSEGCRAPRVLQPDHRRPRPCGAAPRNGSAMDSKPPAARPSRFWSRERSTVPPATRTAAAPFPSASTERHMCGVTAVLTEVLGALYLTGVLAAVLVALVASDRDRRADARKVLHLLLSALPGFRRPRR